MKLKAEEGKGSNMSRILGYMKGSLIREKQSDKEEDLFHLVLLSVRAMSTINMQQVESESPISSAWQD